MKTLKKIFTALAVTVGLATAASAYNNEWTSLCSNATTYPKTGLATMHYAGAQRGIAAEVMIDENATSTAYTIFDYGNGDNRVQLLITSAGKYQLIVNNGMSGGTKFDVTSTTDVTAGRHVFATLVRRGVSGGGHVISVIVYLDGAELFKVGDGSTSFVTGPFRNMACGTSGSANTLSVALWSATESAGTTETDQTKIANIVADANALYPPPEIYTAMMDADKDWADLEWDKELPETLKPGDQLVVNVTGTPTLSFAKEFTTPGKLLINGAPVIAPDESFYEEADIVHKPFATFGKISAPDATSVPARSGYKGGVATTSTQFILHEQTGEVISINIAGGSGGGSGADSPTANLVSGKDYYGLAPTVGDSWNNINRQWQNGGNQTIEIKAPLAYDGAETIRRPTMSLSATGKNTWQCDSISNPFLRGYLDDGNGVTVTVHGVPYTKYDVIVYATSDSSLQLAPVTINGTTYTYVDGELTEGNTAWGVGKYPTPEIGKNAILITDCEGELLTISAAKRPAGSSDPRGTFCAVQVINKGEVVITTDYVGVMSGDVEWTNGAEDENLESLGEPWESGDFSTITITNKAENATFTFAEETEGLSIKFVSEEGCALTIDAKSMVNFGKLKTYDFTEAAGGVTIQLPKDEEIDSSTLPGVIDGDWKFSKDGILVFDGKLPPDSYKTFFTNETDWAGTVWIKNYAEAGAVFNEYGNTNATLRFTGVKGWFNYNTIETTLPIELVDEGETRALEVTDGSLNRNYQFVKITGEGSLNVSSVHTDPFVVQIKDVSEFTGKITTLASTTPSGKETTGFPIYIGEGKPSYGSTSKITVASGTTINAPCGWESEAVAFGTNLTVKGAVEGDVIVSGVTTEPYLGTKVTIEDDETVYCLTHDANDLVVKIAKPVAFTVSPCANATFTVEGAFEDGGSYYAADGALLKITYTADAGYAFSDGTNTKVIEDRAAEDATFEAGEEPTNDPFVYTIAEGEEGAWTWNGESVEESFVDKHTAVTIVKEGDGTLTKELVSRYYIVNEGTFVTTNAVNARATVTVNEGGIFDFNGSKDGYVTVNLAGGMLVNNGAEMGTNSRQIEGITITADSVIGGTGDFGMSSNQHHANTLSLGDATLTKEGGNTFFLINTTVTNGTVNVTDGTLRIYESETTFIDAGLNLASGVTLQIDSALSIGAISADDATISNAGTISSFTLSGSATFAGVGTWNTNTLDNATVNVGNLRDFVFAGNGTVNVQLKTEEYEAKGEPITVFTSEVDTVVIGAVTDADGSELTLGTDYTVEGGVITPVKPGGDVPSWIDPQDTTNKALYDNWAENFGVTDPSVAKQDAFLLNCANTDEAIEEAKKEFVLTITFDEDGNPVVEYPENYNGTVTLQGKQALTDEEWHEKTEGDQFFQATLQLIPANVQSRPITH